MKTVVHIVVCLHEPVPLQRYEMMFEQLPADRQQLAADGSREAFDSTDLDTSPLVIILVVG